MHSSLQALSDEALHSLLFDILKAIAEKEKSAQLQAAPTKGSEAPANAGAALPAPDQATAPVVPLRESREKGRRKPAAQGERTASAQAPGRPAVKPEAPARPQQQASRKGRPEGQKPAERDKSPAPRARQAEQADTGMPGPVTPAAGPVVRYMHPANRHLTWDGEGEQPDWVTAYLAHGGSWTAMENTAQKLAGQRRNPLEW